MWNRSEAGSLGPLLPIGVILVCATVAAAAQAQGVFRTVGPDGSVTYSDAPPSAADAQASTVDVTPAAGVGKTTQPGGMPSERPSVSTQRFAKRRVATALQANGTVDAPTAQRAPAPAEASTNAPVLTAPAARPSSLDPVTLDLVRGALAGTAFVVMPDPFSSMAAETSAPCPVSRQFVVFRRPATADVGDKPKSQVAFSHNLSVALCRGGPLGPEAYAALFLWSEEYLRQAVQTQPALAQYGQRSVNIGGRKARVGPLAVIGHGVTITPVGVVESRAAGSTLVASIDDATAHIGEPGRLTMKEALDQLETVLRAADAAVSP